MNTARRPRWLTLAAVSLLVAILIGCSSHRASTEFQGELEYLKMKTVPAGGTLVSESGPTRGSSSLTATWDIEAPMEKAEYLKWVASQLQPDFKIGSSDKSHLTFFKDVDGDSYSVQCDLTEQRPLGIHLTLKVQPN